MDRNSDEDERAVGRVREATRWARLAGSFSDAEFWACHGKIELTQPWDPEVGPPGITLHSSLLCLMSSSET